MQHTKNLELRIGHEDSDLRLSSVTKRDYNNLLISKKKHTFVELKIIRLTTRLIIYSHHILIWTP